MTREEAIEQLQNCKDLIKQDGQDYLDERDIPLLDMAIESLSAPSGDLISRADAIKAVAEHFSFDDGCSNIYKDIDYYKGIAEHILKNVPSALPSADAVGVGRYENAMQKLREMPRYLNGVKEKQITKISADAVPIQEVKLKDGFKIDDVPQEWTPTILGNVEVVVRCKDCRYFKKIVERSDSGLCHRDIVASAWKENGYCSRGERND